MDDTNRVSEETAAEDVVSADNAADEAETATDAKAAPETEAPAETEAEASSGDDGEGKKKNRKTAKERIAELTRQRREAEERARKAEAALAKRPQPEDFDDSAAYEEARDDYLYNRRRVREERELAQAVTQTITDEVAADFRHHAAAFRVEAPDFEQVAYMAPISDPIANMIAMMGEDGPRVAYALGKDHQLARDLSSLPPAMAAMELGKLAASAKPQRRLTSKAPPPVAPVTGAGGPVNRDPGEMTPAEYRAFRMGKR